MVEGSSGRVEVGVLGPFEVSVDGERVELPSGRLSVLLAVLAMSAGRSVSIDRLAEALWGDEEDWPANVRRTLQTYVLRLRAALGAGSIRTELAGYALATDSDRVDALRFLRLVERAAEKPDVERRVLAEAVGLWRGSAFEGLESRWLQESESVRLNERRLSAIERRVALDLAGGHAQDVVAELCELTREHPLREPIWAQLLLALAQSGRPAEALEQYEVVRSRIADEFGVDPGVGLQRIYANLLSGAELEAAGAAPQPSKAVVPRQLPGDLVGFTGRSGALAGLDALSDTTTESPVLVVVHGPGGVGKTSLVVHWAHRVADRFADGQLYVNLRGYGPGEPMAAAAGLELLLRGLGVSDQQIPPDVEGRSSLLRSELADRPVLMVLDNARDSEQVRPLLPGTGGSVVVVTSRSQLRGLVAREGAQRLGLEQLDPAESTAMLASVLDIHEVRHHQAVLGELAERCGHLPLALAVAAERAGRHPDTGLPDLVDELRGEQERLDALAIGDESVDLRAVFAASYQALDPDTARMFRLAGLHPGVDFSRPAAAALAGVDAAVARRLVDKLVDHSLLQQRRHGRYELHDLLRSYAAELVGQDPLEDQEGALDRILSWYVHSTANAANRLSPEPPLRNLGAPLDGIAPAEFQTSGQAQAWLQQERGTLIAAVSTAARLGRHLTAWRLASALWRYQRRVRALDEELAVSRVALESARQVGGLEQALVTMRIGLALMNRKEYATAREHLERAAALYEREGDEIAVGRAQGNLGVLALHTGRFEEAADNFTCATERLVSIPAEYVFGLNNLALANLRMGRCEDAVEAVERALAITREVESDRDEAVALDTLGQALLGLGRGDEAIERFRRSCALLAAEGDRWSEGAVLANLGRAFQAAGRYAEARDVWTTSLEIIEELGAPDGPEYDRAVLRRLLARLPAE